MHRVESAVARWRIWAMLTLCGSRAARPSDRRPTRYSIDAERQPTKKGWTRDCQPIRPSSAGPMAHTGARVLFQGLPQYRDRPLGFPEPCPVGRWHEVGCACPAHPCCTSWQNVFLDLLGI